MRTLWHSVAPWIKIGYGTQTAIFTRRIRDLLGHEIAISTWIMRDGLMEYDGFTYTRVPETATAMTSSAATPSTSVRTWSLR